MSNKKKIDYRDHIDLIIDLLVALKSYPFDELLSRISDVAEKINLSAPDEFFKNFKTTFDMLKDNHTDVIKDLFDQQNQQKTTRKGGLDIFSMLRNNRKKEEKTEKENSVNCDEPELEPSEKKNKKRGRKKQ